SEHGGFVSRAFDVMANQLGDVRAVFNDVDASHRAILAGTTRTTGNNGRAESLIEDRPSEAKAARANGVQLGEVSLRGADPKPFATSRAAAATTTSRP